jgi:hypothetical protein
MWRGTSILALIALLGSFLVLVHASIPSFNSTVERVEALPGMLFSYTFTYSQLPVQLLASQQIEC